METVNYDKLNVKEKKLLNSAEKALKNAYNPYTKSYVAGAVLTESGKIITGACFGNASTSVNICAERSVMITANSLGHRDIKMLAIIAKSETKNYPEPLTPCGVCRQFLLETTKITGKDLIIISSNSDKTKIIRTSLNELFPYPYSR